MAADGIFLYEDDEALAAEIVAGFAAEGLVVSRLRDEADLIATLRSGRVAALILDRMVDGRDTLDLLTAERAGGDRTPVLVASSLATVDDRIRGFKAGGDDYLVKPFAMAEMIVRVAALRRRSESRTRDVLSVGSLSMDLKAGKVSRAGRTIALLPKEFALLEYLMRHAGMVVTRAMLLEDIWNYRITTHTNVVDVHVGNLRRKIEVEGEPRLIASVRGLGFRFSAADETA